jgi:hypothetical protein
MARARAGVAVAFHTGSGGGCSPAVVHEKLRKSCVGCVIAQQPHFVKLFIQICSTITHNALWPVGTCPAVQATPIGTSEGGKHASMKPALMQDQLCDRSLSADCISLSQVEAEVSYELRASMSQATRSMVRPELDSRWWSW